MNLLIWGISGKMGQHIFHLAKEDPSWTNIDGINSKKNPEELEVKPHVVIDFSHPTALKKALDYCLKNSLPLVIGTTGYNAEEINLIKEAATRIPILQATNMSMGMNLMFSLVEKIAAALKDKVDIEVIEAHHNRKKDAPSGSAVTIIQSIEKGLGHTAKKQYGREGQCPRDKGEIGVHAIRGGNIVGLHEAHFINELETIKLIHEAHDRSVFAQGALTAAKFIADKGIGLYSMRDVLGLD
ncbi:4-hydroxy-tetrahydrodipicolinate reductase [Alkaliphilus serpentinus]|uniref:4-hydroxy-tetrahydrodipicolinate reductase n=1 Tax=Alkaliphilus serpentinus TaxID=1482731 RepID=A0A833HN26_9FIRM|nr:4-hydroxy-tetrahydrodipicolinate reductase [Alkaliphilus serpentinus]KAB3529069.1 4-hydroxy-tetrahydrodipicolinate reductase [Alkaliphilus serpentinus]